MPHTLEAKSDIRPYLCRVSGSTFSKPCTVLSCFAHAKNLNESGVHTTPITNCSHVDFQLAGFAEDLDYAVEEQGFVGYSDLQYISAFLRVNPIKLREIYTDNIELLRRAISLVWAVKHTPTAPCCERCGHPTKSAEQIRCVSVSMCDERLETVSKIATPFLKAFKDYEVRKAYNILWRSLTEKFVPGIILPDWDKTELDNLRSSK